jgi:hypothetical protein
MSNATEQFFKHFSRVKKENISDKAFESLFFDFADRADFRWVFAGAEIPADRTTPDREWQGG